MVSLLWPIDLNPEDLLWVVEDLPDAQGLIFSAFEDLYAERVDDPVTAVGIERRGLDCSRRRIAVASGSSEEFEGTGRAHRKGRIPTHLHPLQAPIAVSADGPACFELSFFALRRSVPRSFLARSGPKCDDLEADDCCSKEGGEQRVAANPRPAPQAPAW